MKKKSQSKKHSVEGITFEVHYRKRPGAKGIRMKISSGDAVIMTAHTRVSFFDMEKFFLAHQKWAVKKLKHFQVFPNPTIKLSPAAYLQKKEKTRTLVLEKLNFWNRYYEHTWKRVTIRNQSTRWGSCSSALTLSFHAGLIDLPEDLQDYLIVHELCHLKVMNHGSQFWKLIEQTLPTGRQLDERLKKYSGGSIL